MPRSPPPHLLPPIRPGTLQSRCFRFITISHENYFDFIRATFPLRSAARITTHGKERDAKRERHGDRFSVTFRRRRTPCDNQTAPVSTRQRYTLIGREIAYEIPRTLDVRETRRIRTRGRSREEKPK